VEAEAHKVLSLRPFRRLLEGPKRRGLNNPLLPGAGGGGMTYLVPCPFRVNAHHTAARRTGRGIFSFGRVLVFNAVLITTRGGGGGGATSVECLFAKKPSPARNMRSVRIDTAGARRHEEEEAERDNQRRSTACSQCDRGGGEGGGSDVRRVLGFNNHVPYQEQDEREARHRRSAAPRGGGGGHGCVLRLLCPLRGGWCRCVSDA